jgi:hypothetical protein
MYVVQTYKWMNPYIKGLHNTIDSWQEGRTEDGFKWTAKKRRRMQSLLFDTRGLPCRREEEDMEDQTLTLASVLNEGSVPETVLPTERYLQDLDCLHELTLTAEPPKQLTQAKQQSA